MLKLKCNLNNIVNYKGFEVKQNFWYGTDTDTGEDVATSGWEIGNNLVMYYFNPKTSAWELRYVDIYDTEFELENVSQITTNFSSKKSFNEWLKTEKDMTFNDYDDYPNPDEITSEYDDYYYDYLPKFVRPFL